MEIKGINRYLINLAKSRRSLPSQRSDLCVQTLSETCSMSDLIYHLFHAKGLIALLYHWMIFAIYKQSRMRKAELNLNYAKLD